MSQVTLNGEAVLSLRLEMSLRGPWVAEVEIGGDVAPTGQAVLLFDSTETDEQRQMIGAVRESGVYEGRAKAFIVGGTAGLRTTLPAKSYVDNPPARIIVDDLLREAGEAMADGVATTLDALSVDSWVRAGGEEAGTELGALVDRLDLSWRVLAGGAVWVGRETWPPFSSARNIPQPMAGALEDGVALFAPALPNIIPGVNLDGKRVGRVVYTIDSGLRAQVTFLPAGSSEDRENEWARSATRKLFPESVFSKLYDATVIAQDSDNTLQVVCDDETIGGLSRVPIWPGLPGVRVQVAQGARVTIAFHGGRRDRRYCKSFATDAAMDEIRVDGGTKGVARVDDTVDLGTITATCAAAPGPVLFTYTPPGGMPQVPTETLHITEAMISSGSLKLKA